MVITALSGGIGGAKLVLGFSKVLGEGQLTVVGNTGDDFELFGLHISPDLDIVMYTLADIVDEQRGWGIRDDTFTCLDTLSRKYGFDKWFNLGDRDLATHIYRTALLRQGFKLSQVTRRLCSVLGVTSARLIPMTDDKIETLVRIQDKSLIHFQEYFVKRGCRDEVAGVIYRGSRNARPSQGVLKSFLESDLIVICPSNPVASIGPILSMQALRNALRKARCPVVAVTPIVHGAPLKGPADKFMRGLKIEVTALGVAKLYREYLHHFILDESDSSLEPKIRALGINTITTNTIMNTLNDKVRLARTVLEIGDLD